MKSTPDLAPHPTRAGAADGANATHLASPLTGDAELDVLGDLGAALMNGRAGLADLAAQVLKLRVERDRALDALALSRARESLAWERAQQDTLTGLPNRLGFEAVWQQALAAHANGPRLFALLFIDLDGFKAINDRLGHPAGDELLTIIGARLAHALRRGDTVYRHGGNAVCRHGGDEFLCLLTQLHAPSEAHRIADWLLRTIAAPCRLQAAPALADMVSVHPSIGIAFYPQDGRTAAALIERADAAMYRAKSGHLGIADGSGEVLTLSGLARRGLSRPSGPSSCEAVPAARGVAAPSRHRSSRRLQSPD